MRILVKGKLLTSLPVSEHLSSYHFTNHLFIFCGHILSFFKKNVLTSKYCASCTLAFLVNTCSKISPNSIVKIIPYHFSLFFFYQVGVILIFLVVLLVNFYLVEGEDQTSKKLEPTHGGKRDSYQDIEDPNQTITQLSINCRTHYEDLGDCDHNLYDSTLEGSRNKQSCDEDGEAGPSGEGYSSDKPPKTWRMYG